MARAATKDDDGGSDVVWNPLVSVWAAISIKSGTESEIGGAIQSKGRYNVLIRERSDIKPSMRVTWKDKTLNIVSILPVAIGRLRLECEEIGDAGEL
jgi:SPP1 family predicted phage head-tail adaptor